MPEVSSGYFPDYNVAWDIKVGRRYKTKVTVSKTGIEKRRKMFPAPASSGTGQRGGYGTLSTTSAAYTAAERYAVASFLDSMEGMFRAFYLFRRDRDDFVNYEVGSVTAQSSIIIPFKDSTVTSVTVADISKAVTVTPLIGAGGEDRINFTAGIQTGIVRVTLRGRERWLVRSESDELIESFIQNVASQKSVVSLGFKQVR